jgi:hypothetical protein
MYWSSKELLESNNLLAGWSGFELRSTPLQSKKITVVISLLILIIIKPPHLIIIDYIDYALIS